MAVVLAVLAVAMVCCSFSEAHAARHRVMRGLVDDTWVKAQGTERTKIVRELSRQLHAQVVRIAVSWASAEPAQGQYNAAYLQNVRAAAAEARAALRRRQQRTRLDPRRRQLSCPGHGVAPRHRGRDLRRRRR